MKRWTYFLLTLTLSMGALFLQHTPAAGADAAAAQEPGFVPSEELPADSAVSFPVDI